MKYLTLLALGLGLSLGMATTPVSASTGQLSNTTGFEDFKGLWVTRWDFSSASGIHNIINKAADIGITDVMFQVRGRADAYYDSNYEPQVIGYDALQVAIDAAHAKGLKLHAWVNMMPMWQGTTAPTNPDHIFNAHPEWRLYDKNGNPQPLNDSYVVVNPILNEVHGHLANVTRDIASNYAVDGIHMDYIRFPPGRNNSAGYPADDLSYAMYEAATGKTYAQDPAGYWDFLASRITDLVGTVRDSVKPVNGNLALSAAVWRDPNIGLRDYMQDYAAWIDQGLLDAVMPMIYTESLSMFEDNLNTSLNLSNRHSAIIPGIGSYMHGNTDTLLAQLEAARRQGSNGYALYAYDSLFDGSTASNTRLAAYRAFLTGATPTNINTIDNFESGEGHFTTHPTWSGSTKGALTSSTASWTDEAAQEGNHAQKLVIKDDPNVSSGWTVRHVSGGGSQSNNTVFASKGWIGFWAMTLTEGVEAAIALDDPTTGDRGYSQHLVADGQWHVYQWALDDPGQWLSWAGGNGQIDGDSISIDSILLYGGNFDAIIYLDSIFHSPDGLIPQPIYTHLPAPASLVVLLAGLPALTRRRRH